MVRERDTTSDWCVENGSLSSPERPGFRFCRRGGCPVCSGTETTRLFECAFLASPIRDYLESFYGETSIRLDRLEEASYLLDECRSCGLVFQRDIFDADLMQELYDEWIDPTASRASSVKNALARRTSFTSEILRLAHHFGGDLGSINVLDFGMGWGDWCRIAEAMGLASAGLEFSKSRVSRASDLGIRLFSLDELPDGVFHFINANQVFEHLTDPLGTAKRLRRALRPDGILRISVPYGSDIHRRLATGRWTATKGTRDSLNAVSPLEHINCFSGSALVALGQAAGYRPFQYPLALAFSFFDLDKQFRPLLRALARPVRARVRSTGTDRMFIPSGDQG